MDKRKLSAIPRENATEDMIDIAGRLNGMDHIVTARLVGDNKILLLNFYEIRTLKKGKTEAVFRTFLSSDDYITQDLKVSKTKWSMASFTMMDSIALYQHRYNVKTGKQDIRELIFIHSEEEKEIIRKFFAKYEKENNNNQCGMKGVWDAVNDFQEKVKKRRLAQKHKKETDAIDLVMENVGKPPGEFFNWVWEEAMSFSRYLFYKAVGKNNAECECSYCKKTVIVDRNEIRLRNNEKGVCPSCGNNVTIKARGKLPYRITDERWVVYVDPTNDGFNWRYFHAHRTFERTNLSQPRESILEATRTFYTFPNGKPVTDSYEYTTFKSTGKTRWCHDESKINCGLCILYPGNLPIAWEHTPMKYSAIEELSKNMPTESIHYEWAINRYMEFPKLEWLCKMGLNRIAESVINEGIRVHGWLKYESETIFDVLRLNKVNTRILQSINGCQSEMRLLQVAQQIGLYIKPEQLREYYDTFECNTTLLKEANRKVSLHKLVKYISKESERYPMGDRGGCWQYSYNRLHERADPRIERKQNMAKDWLEYLEWCKTLKYDLNNMFIYMPNNFKHVHDRTAKEYQALQDKKAAAEKKKQEALAKKRMEQTRKAMEEIFKKNEGIDAFSIKGNGLLLVVPTSGADIKAEGEALHHCVGGYVERVARGETNIFFVRKEEEPQKPYFTMEWKDNKIIQCRGYKNCGMPKEVDSFVKAFEKKMLSAIKQDKDRRAG